MLTSSRKGRAMGSKEARDGRDRGHPGFGTRRERLAILLLVPATVFIVLLIGWPLVLTVDLSFHDVKLFQVFRDVDKPLSFKNFQWVLTDPKFYRSIAITAEYVVASTGIALLWGMGTALLLNTSFPLRRVIRTVMIMPWAVAPVIASLVWMFLFDGHLGLINHFLLQLGVIDETIPFLVYHGTALWTVIVVFAWKQYPFFTIMFLAGLQAIPHDLYEAARVDGASSWRRFRDITLPGLRQIMTVAGILSVLTSFREVETILVMTGGGPSRQTETIAVKIYNETFRYFDVGRASSYGVIAFLISLATIVVIFSRLRDDFYR